MLRINDKCFGSSTSKSWENIRVKLIKNNSFENGVKTDDNHSVECMNFINAGIIQKSIKNDIGLSRS